MAIADRPIPAENFSAELRRMTAFVANGSLEPALRECKLIAEEEFLQNFLEGRRADGTPWPPRKHDYAWPILIKTGHLMHSAVSEGEPGHVENVGAREMFTGTNVFYAGFHQYGTKKLPPRPFVEVSNHAIDRMEEAVATFVIHTIFGG